MLASCVSLQSKISCIVLTQKHHVCLAGEYLLLRARTRTPCVSCRDLVLVARTNAPCASSVKPNCVRLTQTHLSADYGPLRLAYKNNKSPNVGGVVSCALFTGLLRASPTNTLSPNTCVRDVPPGGVAETFCNDMKTNDLPLIYLEKDCDLLM